MKVLVTLILLVGWVYGVPTTQYPGSTVSWQQTTGEYSQQVQELIDLVANQLVEIELQTNYIRQRIYQQQDPTVTEAEIRLELSRINSLYQRLQEALRWQLNSREREVIQRFVVAVGDIQDQLQQILTQSIGREGNPSVEYDEQTFTLLRQQVELFLQELAVRVNQLEILYKEWQSLQGDTLRQQIVVGLRSAYVYYRWIYDVLQVEFVERNPVRLVERLFWENTRNSLQIVETALSRISTGISVYTNSTTK